MIEIRLRMSEFLKRLQNGIFKAAFLLDISSRVLEGAACEVWNLPGF